MIVDKALIQAFDLFWGVDFTIGGIDAQVLRLTTHIPTALGGYGLLSLTRIHRIAYLASVIQAGPYIRYFVEESNSITSAPPILADAPDIERLDDDRLMQEHAPMFVDSGLGRALEADTGQLQLRADGTVVMTDATHPQAPAPA